MADLSSRRTAGGTAVRAALAAAVAGLALASAFAARRAGARGKRTKALRACADKPGSSRELLQLASSHVRWLAGAPPHAPRSRLPSHSVVTPPPQP